MELSSCARNPLDRLAGIFARLRVSAHVFCTGPFRDPVTADHPSTLHVVEKGAILIRGQRIAAPAVVLVGGAHDMAPDAPDTHLACAAIDLGGPANPVAQALPPLVVITLGEDEISRTLSTLLSMLLAEAEQRHCGHQAVMDRLAEAALVMVLRHSMESADGIGLLAGLAHPQLRFALTAMHDQPGQDWTLERLAETAGLSRSVFAETFHRVVGQSPGQYLNGWRMVLARNALELGQAVKTVARDVGYASPAALSRAITRHFGTTARDLIKATR